MVCYMNGKQQPKFVLMDGIFQPELNIRLFSIILNIRNHGARKVLILMSFNIQLGGMQDYEGIFSEMDESGYYWTSTEYDNDNAEYFSYLHN